MDGPVESHPPAEPARRPGEGLDLDVIRAGVLRHLHHVAVEGRRDDGEQVVLVLEIDLIVAQDRARPDDQIDRRHGGGAGVVGPAVQGGDDRIVDAAVDDAHRGFLHDPALIALTGQDVEFGLADQIVPFAERRGALRVVVGARRDEAVDASADGACRTGIGYQEDRLVAADVRLLHGHAAQNRLTVLETGDEFLPILSLKGSLGHGRHSKAPERSWTFGRVELPWLWVSCERSLGGFRRECLLLCFAGRRGRYDREGALPWRVGASVWEPLNGVARPTQGNSLTN